MLKTRVLTALALLAVLLPVLHSGSWPAFCALATVFFGAAAWESFRLFGRPYPIPNACAWTLAFAAVLWQGELSRGFILYGVCLALWALRFAPALGRGLPPQGSLADHLLNGLYGVAILGCFVAVVALFRHSPLYLLSVMAMVWVADIGAYFSGKAFGRRKLAPSISPGKSWEGALGGALAVLLLGALAVAFGGAALADTFGVRLQAKWGWVGFAAVSLLMAAASVVGDLFESQLKRRAGMKDSSGLLPGHGGVLDRIDALIPTLPLAALLDVWL